MTSASWAEPQEVEARAALRRSNRRRKAEHLSINLDKDVQFHGVTSGFDGFYFVHQALPELDLAAIDLSLSLWTRSIAAPLFISSMVGGVEAAGRINLHLAEAAQECRIAMGLGSQRAAIDDPNVAWTYQVRRVAPDIPLFANLGAVQLNYGFGLDECRRAVDMVEADALILHLNPLQEALQTDGNTDFSGLLRKIERVVGGLPVPVVVKEVSWGISEEVARKLSQVGVAAIEVGGAGGTSWGEVERRRSGSPARRRIAATFEYWGIPTTESIMAVRRGAPGMMVLASGGVRTGVDVAKTIALGARAAGLASPMLKAADVSTEAVVAAIREVVETLQIAMFCIGAGNLDLLRDSTQLERARNG